MLPFLLIGPAASGKTTAADIFSEFGYMLISRFPFTAIERVISETTAGACGNSSPPIVFSPSLTLQDIETFRPEKAISSLTALLEKYGDIKILVLDAPEQVLIRRFQESGKKHPLEMTDGLQSAIRLEKGFFEQLKALKGAFQNRYYAIDTQNLPPRELYGKIAKVLGMPAEAMEFTVCLTSFGYKHGVPLDSDFIFDMRFLDNPFYIDALKPLTGLDQPVVDYIFSVEGAETFLSQWTALLKTILPLYKAQGKTRLSIAIGCTGGQHRSVCMTEILGKSLTENYPEYNVLIHHREESKWPVAPKNTILAHPSQF